MNIHPYSHRPHWGFRQNGAALIVGLVLLVVITLVGVGAMQSTTLQEKMAGNLRDSNLSFQASEAALRNCENILTQDYQFQVLALNLTAGDPLARTTPPQAPLRDQIWQLVNPDPNLDLNSSDSVVIDPQVWVWSLDENQATALFPGPVARLDPSPANTQFWWVERNDAWWQTVTNDNSGWAQELAANTLDGLNQQPRCILEAYIYAAADNSQTAEAFRRMRHADGLVIKNEIQFRRERNYYRMTSRGQGGSQTAISLLQSGVYQIYFVQN